MNPDIQLNKATEQIHVAAQYLAMVGKYFVTPKDDDSHTNLGWDLNTQQFFTHRFSEQEVKIFLRPSDLRLGIGAHPEHLSALQSLQGLTQREGSQWIKSQLARLGLDSKTYQVAPHYELPAYADFDQEIFEISDPSSYNLFSDVRGWAKRVLIDYKNSFGTAHDDRTWPHHFDHGCYVPLSKDKTGEVISSISFGLAVHDHLQSSHYLYVTHWTAQRPDDLNPPKLSAGRWEMERMHGALLPVSAQGNIELDAHSEHAHAFMQEAINASLGFLKL